jgi:hypothetical protein
MVETRSHNFVSLRHGESIGNIEGGAFRANQTTP